MLFSPELCSCGRLRKRRKSNLSDQESLSQNFKVKVTVLARFLLERFLLIRASQL